MTSRMSIIKSYPCERNGVLWTHMGPKRETPPPLPELEWNMVPESHLRRHLPGAGVQLAAGTGR